MKIIKEEFEFKKTEGCNYRVDIKKKNHKLDLKIDKLREEIAKLQAQKAENLELDRKLEQEGFCLIDKIKLHNNPLTGKVIKKELVHQDYCISKGE